MLYNATLRVILFSLAEKVRRRCVVPSYDPAIPFAKAEENAAVDGSSSPAISRLWHVALL